MSLSISSYLKKVAAGAVRTDLQLDSKMSSD
jgi:hypothetical protein